MSFLVDMYDSSRTPLAALWLLVGALTIISAVLAVARLLPVSRKTPTVAKPDISPGTPSTHPVEEGSRDRAWGLSLPPLLWLRAHPKIGGVNDVYHLERPAAPAASASGPAAPRPEAPESRGAQPRTQPRLVLTRPARLSRMLFPLTGSHTVVGRAAAAEVTIDDGYVSRAHALLTKTRAGFVVEDLGSVGGTAVNGDRLSGPRRLRHGDTLRLGPNVEARFEEQAEVDQTAVWRPDSDETMQLPEADHDPKLWAIRQ